MAAIVRVNIDWGQKLLGIRNLSIFVNFAVICQTIRARRNHNVFQLTSVIDRHLFLDNGRNKDSHKQIINIIIIVFFYSLDLSHPFLIKMPMDS